MGYLILFERMRTQQTFQYCLFVRKNHSIDNFHNE